MVFLSEFNATPVTSKSSAGRPLNFRRAIGVFELCERNAGGFGGLLGQQNMAAQWTHMSAAKLREGPG